MPDASYLFVRQVMQSDKVRRKCDDVAGRIAARLTAIAARDNLSHTAEVVHQSQGTRPLGRPYSRVAISHRTRIQAQRELSEANGGDGSEFGTAKTQRTRLVGQGISGARNPRR